VRARHDFKEQCQVHGWQVAALHTAEENMASRFATSNEEEMERLLIDKDAENTKKIHQCSIGTSTLEKKKIQEPEDKKELAKVLSLRIINDDFFFKTMYNKTVVRFGFCDIRDNHVSVSVISLSGCHEYLIQ